MTEAEERNAIIQEIRAMREAVEEQLEANTQATQEVALQNARLEERVKNIAQTVERLDRAINGNGNPGLKLLVAENARRLTEVEGNCVVERATLEKLDDKTAFLDLRLAPIEQKHDAEAEQEEGARKAEQQKEKDDRNFKYGLITAVVTTVLNLASLAFQFLMRINP
jgi:septal ring factor EnvC (AmiA/AmiB activator)